MSDSEKTETKRDRVRRIFIHPLAELRLTRPKGVKVAEFEADMVKLADDLSYMSDDNLAALRDMIRSKGQGKTLGEWMRRATVLTLAELVQPRPLEEMPNLVSWFRSKAGREAEERGELVQEFIFFATKKRPPLHDGERLKITERTKEDQSLLRRHAEGWSLRPDQQAYLRYLRHMQARVTAIMAGGQEDAA